MKRILCFLLAVLMLALLAGCATKTVHCDACGDEITVEAKSNIEEDWIIFCKTCEEENFGDNPVVSPE